MTPNKHATTLRLFKMLHFALCIWMFAHVWQLFLKQFDIHIAGRYSIFVCAIFSGLLLFFTRIYNAYLVEYLDRRDVSFCLGLSQLLSTALTIGAILVAWNKNYYYPWIFLILLAAYFVLDRLWAALAARLYFKLNKPIKTAVIYRNESDRVRIKEIENYERKFSLDVYIENPADMEEIKEKAKDCKAIFVAGVEANLRNGIAKYCAENDIEGFFLPHVGDIILSGAKHMQAFSVPIMSMQFGNGYPEYMFLKRSMDILFSAVAILLLSPLMLLTALAIRISDGGPAIYRQVRLTENGKEFNILKFRSMRIDAEGDGVARLSSGEDDARITPIGRFLRKTRLDEIPQLFNILKGDMTLVGPRPERPEIARQYEEVIPAFKLRLRVRAGLTGYAQVYGKYNTDPYDKLEMDLMYINNMNLLEDIKLLIATVRILFVKDSTRGVDEGQATALIGRE